MISPNVVWISRPCSAFASVYELPSKFGEQSEKTPDMDPEEIALDIFERFDLYLEFELPNDMNEPILFNGILMLFYSEL